VRDVVFTASEGARNPERWPAAPRHYLNSGDSGISLPLARDEWERVYLDGADGTRVGLYNAAERILFCGDLLTGADIPNIEAGVQSYLDALAATEHTDMKLLVPSQGEIAQGKRSIRQRIETDRSYIQNLLRHVLQSMASGASLDRVLQVAAQVYAEYPFVDQHVRNVRRVWEEIDRET
jgi:hypothetical protein